jgi:hypothetical protein
MHHRISKMLLGLSIHVLPAEGNRGKSITDIQGVGQTVPDITADEILEKNFKPKSAWSTIILEQSLLVP